MKGFLACLVFLLGGCLLQQLSGTEQFTEAVWEHNQALRWGRVDVAVGYVSPSYRGVFIKRRTHWPTSVQLADVDVISLRKDGKQGPRSVAQYSWYRLDTMELEQTLIEQNWKRKGMRFNLVSEKVLSGSAALLVPPPEKHAALTNESSVSQ